VVWTAAVLAQLSGLSVVGVRCCTCRRPSSAGMGVSGIRSTRGWAAPVLAAPAGVFSCAGAPAVPTTTSTVAAAVVVVGWGGTATSGLPSLIVVHSSPGVEMEVEAV
jgi:hypothetical protein